MPAKTPVTDTTTTGWLHPSNAIAKHGLNASNQRTIANTSEPGVTTLFFGPADSDNDIDSGDTYTATGLDGAKILDVQFVNTAAGQVTFAFTRANPAVFTFAASAANQAGYLVIHHTM